MSAARPHRSLSTLLALALVAALAACGGDGSGQPGDDTSIPSDTGSDTGVPGDVGGDTAADTTPDTWVPPTGATEFVSADGNNGERTASDGDAFGSPGDGDEGGGDRSVEEGDIYRVLDDGLVLNLNSWRGVQVIDVSDPESPSIIGRLRVSGTPVEMYVVGDTAFVLLNNWRGYYGVRGDIAVDTVQGGLVLAVDLTDPTNPAEIDRAYIPGWVRTSRLTRGSEGVALYVANSAYAEYPAEGGGTVWESRTIVQSFDVTDGTLDPVTQLDLGGYVVDIQATTEALLVARNYWNRSDSFSRVAVVDITDAGGFMNEVGEVRASGYVRNQFNMDVHDGVVRVVSDGNWSGRDTNHLETFDLDTLEPIDHCTFGDGENLYATIFLDDRAFFVTYLRVDPYHAFALSADGRCEERTEFIVSGWNDFFRPVMDDTRLIGVGINDEDRGRTLSVSLYDIEFLDEPEPLVARAEVEADHSWSEASWDHRAFSVLEDAVDVLADDGTAETGLVLLPFQGYDEDWRGYRSSVQIFTFSGTTLTRRGLMHHGTPVRRSFPTADEVVANLSEVAMSLFDIATPDAPVELGSVELAPNNTEILTYGSWRARVRAPEVWWYTREDIPPATVDIVAGDDDPDLGEAVASFEIPGNAAVYKVGDVLVAVDMQVVDTSEWPYDYHSTLTVWDLSDPTAPRLADTLEDDRLRPSYGYYGYGMWDGDCWDCGGWWWGGTPRSDVESVPDGLAFLVRNQEQELLGSERVCNRWPVYEACSDPSEGDEADCVYLTGNVTCRTLEGEDTVCVGGFQRCSWEDDEYVCEAVAESEIETTESCYTTDRYRYWQSFDLVTLDVTVPDDAALSDTIDLPLDDEGVGILADGSTVWVSYKRPYDVVDDSRPYVRYYLRGYDLSTPSDPVAGTEINVPGELVAADGDVIYTRDFLWGDVVVESAVARLRLHDDLAYLEAARRFEDQQVEALMLDGGGNVLVSHRTAWQVFWRDGMSRENLAVLSILDAESDDLAVLSEFAVDSWANLRDAVAGRALFAVPSGLLVVNTDNGAFPFAQAFFATTGWPQAIHIDARDILFAAGRYGVYEFDLDAFNLLAPL